MGAANQFGYADLDVYQQFVVKPREFVVVNGTDEPMNITFDGTTRTVPPFDQVAEKDERRPHLAHSWYADNNRPVPGTLVVADIYEIHPGSNAQVLAWDAREALIHSLGITKDGTPSAPVYRKGLTLMPGQFAEEDIALAKAKSRQRYEKWLVDSARGIVANYDSRNDARRRAGLQDIPGGRDYMQAVAVLRAQQQREQIDAERSLGLEAPVTEDLLMYTRRRVADLAKEGVAGTEIAQDKAAEELAKDPEVVKQVKEEYRKRQRGA